MNKNEQCEQLFNQIKSVAKSYSDVSSLIESLGAIVQNPNFMNPQDIYQWKQECQYVARIIDSNTKECKDSLRNIYGKVIKIYSEL